MKTILNIIIGTLLLAVATLQPATANAANAKTTAEACWNDAIAAYVSGDYEKAVEGFEQVVKLGYPSADVYYNLANAYFKLGQQATHSGNRQFAAGELGRAVLNYHRALRLNPAMEDARYNLELAVDYTNDTESVPESFIAAIWRGMCNATTSNTWTIISLVVLAVMLAMVIFYLLSDNIILRKISFFTAILLLIGFVLSTSLGISSRSALKEDNRAVIVCKDTTPVHASPDSGSKIIRQPSQGVTIGVARSHGEWSEIIFADGEKGWIRTSNIEMI